jgi:hypothetical protein
MRQGKRKVRWIKGATNPFLIKNKQKKSNSFFLPFIYFFLSFFFFFGREGSGKKFEGENTEFKGKIFSNRMSSRFDVF